MTKSLSSGQLVRLQRLAALQTLAAQQAIAPIQMQRKQAHDDIEALRHARSHSRQIVSDAAGLSGQSRSAQLYDVWCNQKLGALQMKLARLEVSRAPLAKKMALSEGRRLVLKQLAQDAKSDAQKDRSA